MLESKIEETVCKYAEANGFLVYKFTSPNRRNVPDRLFIHHTGDVTFVEFKAEGKKPTPAQEREHERLKGHRVSVYVVDNIADGKAMIDRINLFLG